MYSFNPEDAERFAYNMHARVKRQSDQLMFEWCPACNGGGKDKNTFYISLKTGQFECKRSSCGYKGNMITLARDFSSVFDLGNDVRRYYNIDNFNGRFRKFRADHVDSRDPAIAYMATRGISEAVCRKYEITSKEGSDNIIVFPFRDQDGEIRFIKYRNTEHKKGDPGSKEWCETNCMPILFGMQFCDPDKPLVITEGQIDSLSLAEAGIDNAVSVPTGANGFTWVPHCWNWIQQFKKVIVFGDCERGHITLSDELQRRLGDKLYTVKIEAYKGCKDANDILLAYGKQSLLDAVLSAENKPSGNIKDMSEVKRMNIENMPCVSTGFTELDKLLSGGFHYGNLVILTGKCGDGKSTLSGQLMIQAVRQDVPVLAYSGELMDWYFKNWIDRQIIGRKFISNDDGLKINNWYRNKFMLVDTTNIEDGMSECEYLKKAIQEAVDTYGVRFVCVDNLMSAINAASKTIYGDQSQFICDLAKMAKDNDIIIIVIAHPRKDGSGNENDTISGSADITNRADIVLRYQRPNKDRPDGAERELALTKNRLTGRLTGANPIPLWFDDESKRISDKQGVFGGSYIEDGFLNTSEDEEVPF